MSLFDRFAGVSEQDGARDAVAPTAAFLLVLAVLFTAGSCSPDLHEMVGPRVPFPNVEGSILRNGLPVEGLRVKLVVTDTGSTFAKDHTDAAGRYGFSEVGVGGWTVKIASTDTTDFGGAEYPFTFVRPDTSATIPPIEIALGGTLLITPADGEVAPFPGFTEGPLRFKWTRPDWPDSLQARVQVRLYDPSGLAVWYSAKIPYATNVMWNGICNQGVHVNQPIDSVGAGTYSWRLRIDLPASPLEYTTASRGLILQESIR
jgi:hypothetical protein